MLRRLRKVVIIAIWTIVAIWLVVVISLNVPAVKTYIGSRAAAVLSGKIGAEVTIGRVDLGMLNRAIIDGVSINDRSGKQMLFVGRLSARLQISDLLRGKITIASAQVFGLKADLYKSKGEEQANYRFLVDAFKPDEEKESKPVDLKINSLIIRRSAVVYNDWNAAAGEGFSSSHFNVSGISAHLILNKLSSDSLNLNVRRLAFQEENGINVRHLSLKISAGKTAAELSDFKLQLPCSRLNLSAAATYYLPAGDFSKIENLAFSGQIYDSAVLIADLHLFSKQDAPHGEPVTVLSEFNGTDKSLNISRFELSQGTTFDFSALAWAEKRDSLWDWRATVERMETSAQGAENLLLSAGLEGNLPAVAEKIEGLRLVGEASGRGGDCSLTARLASNIGGIVLQAGKQAEKVSGNVQADSIDLAALTGNGKFGRCSLAADFAGSLAGKTIVCGTLDAGIARFDYNDHAFRDATISADYSAEKNLALAVAVNDNLGQINLGIDCKHLTTNYLTRQNLSSSAIQLPPTTIALSARHVQPSAIGLTDKWGDSAFDFDLDAATTLDGLDNSSGELHLQNLVMTSPDDDSYTLRALDLAIDADDGSKKITCTSDFANILVEGRFRYATIADSFLAALTSHLPALAGKTVTSPSNAFSVYATLTDGGFAQNILGIPLALDEPAHIIAKIDDSSRFLSLNADANSFRYDEKDYSDVYAVASTAGDTLRLKAGAFSASEDASQLLSLTAKTYENQSDVSLAFDSNARNHITGTLNTHAALGSSPLSGKLAIEADILPSSVNIAGATWDVSRAHLSYRDDFLQVDDAGIADEDRFIKIEGQAGKDPGDAIIVTLSDVDVGYILDFVNFHAVDFDGDATGTVKVTSLFSDPMIAGDFDVADFHFEGGAMGSVHLIMGYDFSVGSINIDAKVTEDDWRATYVNGYVNLKESALDIKIEADGSSVDFITKYCGDFATLSNATGWGFLNVAGPLGSIQLTGYADVTADMTVLSTNVTYHLDRQRADFVPDDIIFPGDTIVDRDGNKGILSGHLPHRHLSGISYDFSVKADNLLALDLTEFGEDTFLGTVYATGNCRISEIPGGTKIEADITPGAGSFITYNATSPDRMSDTFVHWRDKNDDPPAREETAEADALERDMLSDLYMNFLIRADERSELRVLMDDRTGDLITLHGSGVINTAFYNKGSFDLFGNYLINDGSYRMTIQDVIKRDFTFKQGGTISFGGDGSQAQLNLQANYTLNSVPLSDINIGKSFTGNNVRVDCIMNITGTADNPQVAFSLDMPTIGSDAKQMIMSMFNDNEELNQQVVYLIAVGRFLNQDNNSTSSQSRTALAMQSILSGTVSQQINSLLENVIANKQWDFGANISTGEEGFNDAEYEGLVSGRMLNSRLLFNGQFGYRDNPNATSSFIGDFDLRYLLVPTGSLAIRIYNETNNRYFTKNTLTTQGVSLIVKKDFAGWRDFFRRKNKTAVTDVPPAAL